MANTQRLQAQTWSEAKQQLQATSATHIKAMKSRQAALKLKYSRLLFEAKTKSLKGLTACEADGLQ